MHHRCLLRTKREHWMSWEEWKMTVNCHVGAGNCTWSSGSLPSALSHWDTSPVPNTLDYAHYCRTVMADFSSRDSWSQNIKTVVFISNLFPALYFGTQYFISSFHLECVSYCVWGKRKIPFLRHRSQVLLILTVKEWGKDKSKKVHTEVCASSPRKQKTEAGRPAKSRDSRPTGATQQGPLKINSRRQGTLFPVNTHIPPPPQKVRESVFIF